jgi:shikimate dehydrogenase
LNIYIIRKAGAAVVVAINAQTRLYLLLGNPVDHSLSPILHNSAFQALGINSVYLASAVEKSGVEEALRGVKALAVSGVNITSPYKEAVIPYLDSISADAEKIKSVNTVVNRNGCLFGTSTDGEGFTRALSEVAPGYASGRKVLIVGAGGAARAVAFSLALQGVEEIHIANRTPAKGLALVKTLQSYTAVKNCSAVDLDPGRLKLLLSRCSLCIYSLPFDADHFLAALKESEPGKGDRLLFDLRYSTEKSPVIKAFEEKGGKAYDGKGMLLWQAVLAFEHFTGREAPVEVMRRALDNR